MPIRQNILSQEIPVLPCIADLYEFVNFQQTPRFEDFDVFTFEETYPQVIPQFPVHKREFYMIFLLKDLQEGSLIINDRSYSQLQNLLLFLGPDHVFGGIRGASMKGYVVAFAPSFVSPMTKDPSLDYAYFDGIHKNLFSLSGEDERALFRLLSCLATEQRTRETAVYLLMGILEKSRALQQKYHLTRQAVSTEFELIREFKRLIGLHMFENHSVDFYADRLHVSPHYLNQKVKSLAGKTAKTLIAERLLFEAKTVLIHSNQNVNALAYSLGFGDTSYFGRFFKRRTGVSPGQFRLNHKKG